MSREMNVLPCFSLLGHEPRSALPFLVPWLFGHQPFWIYVFLWSHFSASRASPMPFSSLLVDPLDLLPFDFGLLAFEWPHRRGKPVLDLLAPFRDAEQFAIGRAQPARFSAESIGGELEQLLIRRQARRKLTKHLVASKPAAVQKSYSNLHGITCEKPNLLLRVSNNFFFAAIEWQKQKRRARAWNQNKNIYTVQEK